MAKSKAIRLKVSKPVQGAEGVQFCPAVLVFDDGTTQDTPIRTFSEMRGKATDHGLSDDETVASPATIAWLKDQEGWPDSQTVGRI